MISTFSTAIATSCNARKFEFTDCIYEKIIRITFISFLSLVPEHLLLSPYLRRYSVYEDRSDDQLSLVLPSPALRLFADDDSWSAWLLQSLSTFAEH